MCDVLSDSLLTVCVGVLKGNGERGPGKEREKRGERGRGRESANEHPFACTLFRSLTHAHTLPGSPNIFSLLMYPLRVGHGGFLYRSPSKDIGTGVMGDPSGRRSPVPAGHTTRAGGVHMVLEQEASLPALMFYRQFLVLVFCNVARLALKSFLR